MVNERLVWYLEKNGLLAKQQCGYRSNRSTVDHLVRLETFIRDAFIHNQHLVAVFFDRCGIFVGRYRPQIPRALGCQRRLALADLGCTVDHLGPTPANLIPPSSFAVSCDLKALWPGVLGCWGMGGRCTTWPINPPEVYTSFGPDPPGKQAAGCPCQSIGWRLCSQSLCANVGWSVCWHCLL